MINPRNIALMALLLFGNSSRAAEKILIDTDPGVDDALAVVFAFSSQDLEVVGLTTIFGNVETELATRNALRLLDIVNRDVPVAEGAVKPLYSKKLPTPDFVHGRDGFGASHVGLYLVKVTMCRTFRFRRVFVHI